MATEVHIQRDYPHPPERVWRALTEPEAIAQWLMRADDFAPRVGHKFKLVAKPQPGWRGFVECEVHERRFAVSWVGNEKQTPMTVTFSLEDAGEGTTFTLDHVGFEGISGWLLARVMMGPDWKNLEAPTAAGSEVIAASPDVSCDDNVVVTQKLRCDDHDGIVPDGPPSRFDCALSGRVCRDVGNGPSCMRACHVNADCPATSYCANGICAPAVGVGASCNDDASDAMSTSPRCVVCAGTCLFPQ